MFGSSNNLNHVPGYITSQKKLVAKILQVGAGGVIAGFSTISYLNYTGSKITWLVHHQSHQQPAPLTHWSEICDSKYHPIDSFH